MMCFRCPRKVYSETGGGEGRGGFKSLPSITPTKKRRTGPNRPPQTVGGLTSGTPVIRPPCLRARTLLSTVAALFAKNRSTHRRIGGPGVPLWLFTLHKQLLQFFSAGVFDTSTSYLRVCNEGVPIVGGAITVRLQFIRRTLTYPLEP